MPCPSLIEEIEQKFDVCVLFPSNSLCCLSCNCASVLPVLTLVVPIVLTSAQLLVYLLVVNALVLWGGG